MDYDYIRKYKLEDVQLKSSRKYFIITSFIIGIVEIVLLIGFRTEPVQFWSVIAIGFMIISLQLYSEVWSIKTENESLNVKLGITQYTIPFRDFINIKLIKRRGKRRGNYDYSYYYDEILQIIYKKNNRMKRLELTTYKNSFTNVKLINEYEVIEFINKFSKEEKDGYLDIRTQEEEKELEEMLSKLLWTNELEYIEQKKVVIVIISTVVITIGIILCFLIPYIIKCNSY